MKFARILLALFGWKITGEIPENLQKYVVIAAPHTSMWDFALGFLIFKALGIRAHYLIKKEMFFFPLHYLLKNLGGIPVDRGSNTVVEDLCEEFAHREKFVVAITPEATRSAVIHWKSGFHRIARQANVPVVAGFLDYKKKIAGIIGIVEIKDDFEKDVKKIQLLYKGVIAKHPEKFILPSD